MATPTTLPASFVAAQVLTAAEMNALRGAFRILQVVQTVKTDTYEIAGLATGASSDITGLSATITPSSTSNKIFVYATVHGSTTQAGVASYGQTAYKIIRGSTDIGIGAADGSRSRISAINSLETNLQNAMVQGSAMFLDSPATTSATTYKLAFVNATGNNLTLVMRCNRNTANVNANYTAAPISQITLFEVSA